MDFRFDGQTTAAEIVRGMDLGRKTFVVTGSSSGLGVETAHVLAEAGATVVMVGRDPARNEQAAGQIRAQLPGADLSTFIADFADLASVRCVADEILAAFPKIDCLINNAGFVGGPLVLTEEGVEAHFAINHLAPFLFTNLLLPALKAAAPSRIVLVSSNAHRAPTFDLDDVNFERRPYDHWSAYAQSKRASVLHAVALAKRLEGTGVTAYVLHPGVIHTNVFRHMPSEEAEAAIEAAKQYGTVVKNVEQGAATQIWAAVAPELADKSGVYLEDCQIAPHIPSNVPSSSGVVEEALDPAMADRLWEASEAMINRSFAPAL